MLNDVLQPLISYLLFARQKTFQFERLPIGIMSFFLICWHLVHFCSQLTQLWNSRWQQTSNQKSFNVIIMTLDRLFHAVGVFLFYKYIQDVNRNHFVKSLTDNLKYFYSQVLCVHDYLYDFFYSVYMTKWPFLYIVIFLLICLPLIWNVNSDALSALSQTKFLESTLLGASI